MKILFFAIAMLMASRGMALSVDYPLDPVVIPASGDLDVCGYGIATVTALVFNSGKYEVIEAGASAAMCATKEHAGRTFIGIVFSEDEKDCGVSSPEEVSREYTGPCKSGWIPAEYFWMIAG